MNAVAFLTSGAPARIASVSLTVNLYGCIPTCCSGSTGIVPPHIMIRSVPSSASPLRCPERKPSPSPTSSSSDATPHAMPNIVRNDLSLLAPIERNTCARILNNARMTIIGRELPWFVTQMRSKQFPFPLSSSMDLAAGCDSPRKSTESLHQDVLRQQWHFRITLPPHLNPKRLQELIHSRQRRLGSRCRVQQPHHRRLLPRQPRSRLPRTATHRSGR